jgi:hypothetical protein
VKDRPPIKARLYRLGVKRDSRGRISKVERIPALRAYLGAAILIGCLWAVSFAGFAQNNFHPTPTDILLAIITGVIGILFGCRVLFCTIWGSLCGTLIADQDGISFSEYFNRLGKVPWREIKGFNIGPAQWLVFSDSERFPRGPFYLLAELRGGAASYEDRSVEQTILVTGLVRYLTAALLSRPVIADSHAQLSPGRPLPPPGALECEANIDLAATKAALEELGQQVKAGQC